MSDHNRLSEMPLQGFFFELKVMTASGTTASHYMNYMNVFFTAQKLNILIDACILDRESGLLQQGCDLTGGKYIR
jgi:transcription initiation factor TFIIH subunit 3